MVSRIDATVPHSPTAYTADMRANFQAAKDEIEELQALVGAGGSTDYLPLTGGTLTGPLIVPNGTPTTPGLEFGNAQTGFYLSGTGLVLRVNGSVSWIWGANGPIVLQPFDVDDQRIINVGAATSGTDALNRNYADARYAPITAVSRLQAEVHALRRELLAAQAAANRLTPQKTGNMPTTLVPHR
jgi:hypothetical protein